MFTPGHRTANWFIGETKDGEIVVCYTRRRGYYRLPRPITVKQFKEYVRRNRDKILNGVILTEVEIDQSI